MDNEGASKCRSIIASLNWAITLRRLDIQYATSTMARYNGAPRKGNLKGALRILGYLKKVTKLKPRLLVNPELPKHEQYPTEDHGTWEDFYPDALEELTSDMPESKGKEIKITIWFDVHC